MVSEGVDKGDFQPYSLGEDEVRFLSRGNVWVEEALRNNDANRYDSVDDES